MDGHGAGLLGPEFAGGECIGVAITGDDEVCAGTADAFDFLPRRYGREKNLRGDAEFAGGEGYSDAMISAGSGDDAGFGNLPGEQIGESAARLERAGVLQEFQFKDEADR